MVFTSVQCLFNVVWALTKRFHDFTCNAVSFFSKSSTTQTGGVIIVMNVFMIMMKTLARASKGTSCIHHHDDHDGCKNMG